MIQFFRVDPLAKPGLAPQSQIHITWLLSLLLFSLVSVGLARLSATFWSRLTPNAVERFVPDHAVPPQRVALPQLPAVTELARLCPGTAPTMARRGAARAAIAQCMTSSDAVPQMQLAEAEAHFLSLVTSQKDAAIAWLEAFDEAKGATRARLKADLAAAQRHQLLGLDLADPAVAAREESFVPASADALVAPLRRALARHSQVLADAKAPALSDKERAIQLGLLATGLRLQANDKGAALLPDRRSLAEQLEWTRLGQQAAAAAPMPFQTLRDVLAAVLGSGLILTVTTALRAVLRRDTQGVARWLPPAFWIVATGLTGLGVLLIQDVSLTGDPTVRLLAQRQGLSVDPQGLPLSMSLAVPALAGVQGWSVHVYWPLLLGFLPLMMAARPLATAAESFARRALEHGGDGVWLLSLTLALATAGAAAFVFLSAAALSEALIALGCIAMAAYLARQAPLANVQGGLTRGSLLIAVVALAVGAGGAVVRGDLGHALVACGVGFAFVMLFGARWLRWLGMSLVALLLIWVAASVHAGEAQPPLQAALAHLPAHAQERIQAWFSVFASASSDLARVRWLAASGSPQGWGLGGVPWQGLTPGGSAHAMPLQGPSDYVAALLAAVWGPAGAAAAVGALMTLLIVTGGLAMRQATLAHRPAVARFSAALGGLGCLVMAFKVLISVSGVVGLLPLTGVPVSLLGYGSATLLATCLYLGLAIASLVQSAPSLRAVGATAAGVHAQGRGAVRRAVRGLAITAAVAGLCWAVLAGWQLRAGTTELPSQHLAEDRAELAQALVRSVSRQPADSASMPCEELTAALGAWDRALQRLEPSASETPLRVQRHAWVEAFEGVDTERSCRRTAKRLARLLKDDAGRVLQPLRNGQLPARRLADFATPNIWRALPGCLQSTSGVPLLGRCQDAAATNPFAASLANDAMLAPALWAPLNLALRQPAGPVQFQQRTVAQGPNLKLTLDPAWQALGQHIADCFTHRQQGAGCDDVAPVPAANKARFHEIPRAAALGMIAVEVDSGRVLAITGAVGDCAARNLRQSAQTDAQGHTAALRAGEHCAQLPDRRSAWLTDLPPVLWPVPPGSSFKPWAVQAGLQSGLIQPGELAHWTGVLALSHDQLSIQRLAVDGSPTYLKALASAGMESSPHDLIWGDANTGPRWSARLAEGAESLEPATLSFKEVVDMRAQKEAGVNIDARYGRARVLAYLIARRIADAAIGGGDFRGTAVGLAEAWRRLDLAARGIGAAPPLHLAEPEGGTHSQQLPPGQPSAAQAQWLLAATSGVTAEAWQGTARGSCRLVFGGCPMQGLAGLSGKTGTSDFMLDEKRSPLAKPGLQLPAKLFAGVFTAPDGRRIAIAVTALRVRQPGTALLELDPSAPAEAALTLMRQLGVQAQPVSAPLQSGQSRQGRV